MKKERRRYLEFESPLADLDEQIAKLKDLKLQGDVDISSEIRRLEAKANSLLKKICSKLTAYQKVQISRHPDRPSSLEYIELVFDQFVELHGDRKFRDDPAIIGGLAELGGQSLMFIGHQKGSNTKENLKRNFGMPRPEGYRKALRLMELAERWRLPILTFIDTPGAYPGLDAEEHGQAEAIAHNIMRMSGLKTPIICVIIGEGGSGGALAIAVGDQVLMMEYATYSVISPEGCAAITWKDGKYAADAAEALCLTAYQTKKLQVVDEIIQESLGGAHRDPYASAKNLKQSILHQLDELTKIEPEKLLEKRCERFRRIGAIREIESKKRKTS